MRYIYMDNFRGFSRTLLSLRQITFLVGENSTGKSSFLKILRHLSSPQFWFLPQHTLQEDPEFGRFGDTVSAWSSDRTCFKLGTLATHKAEKGDDIECVFALCVFEDRDGAPYLRRYLQYADRRITRVVFDGDTAKYKHTKWKHAIQNDDDAVRFFMKTVGRDTDSMRGFKVFPKAVPIDLPLAIAVSSLRRIEKDAPTTTLSMPSDVPFALNTVWIAPIRTKPQRVYDGTKRSYSPEGDHTPYLLSVRAESPAFVKKLAAFGEASGLFQTVKAHSFSRTGGAPFEIVVKFTGAKLCINNVGYGVSQVLPLVVEFLSRSKNSTFAVQQPEVHLHPRAQAALGDLVAELAREREHGFMLETHSEYLLNRCRLNLAKQKKPPCAQVIFFQRGKGGNEATVVPISPDGRYATDQPAEFRDFFIKEEMDLLEL